MSARSEPAIQGVRFRFPPHTNHSNTRKPLDRLSRIMYTRAMTNENVYQAPAGHSSANHGSFSAEEWRYITKVFTVWLIGLAIWQAAGLTFFFHFSLSQFGAADFLARVALLALAGEYGPQIVTLAAFNTLVMITERRAKREFLQPVDGLPWWTGAALGLSVPVAMFVAISTSLLLITFVAEIPWATSWQSARKSYGLKDIAFVVIQWLPPTLVLMFASAPLMRFLFRFRGRLVLRLFAAMFVVGTLLQPLRKIAVELVLHR